MSTTFKNIVNRFNTTIKAGSSINNSDDPVTFNITDDTGLPSEPFYITVEQLTDNTVYERMLVTGVSGDELTATRAQDGSSKQTFAAGDLVQIRVIAAHIDEPTDAINILEDIKDYADSPMVIAGGVISDGTNAGTFKVTALTALFRTTDSITGELVELALAEQDNQAITAADTTYFISLNYNDGVTPTITLSTTKPYGPDAADYRNIPIGKVMKDGSDNVHYISGGFNFQDGVEKLHQRALELRALELQSGSTIAYSGTNNFTMELGVAYGGINRISFAQYDSAAVQFTGVRGDGGAGWTEALSNVIDYAHYDDGAGALGNIANNKYGVHWVYRHIDDGHVYVRLGLDSYSLAGAEDAQEPTKPTHLSDFGVLIGKIIAPQAGGSFTLIQMVTDIIFTGTAASDHGNLTGLADDDHTQYALLVGRAGGQTLIGGTASGNDLTLQSSSDGTKGNIYLGAAQTSYFDETTENLIITGDIGLTGTRVVKGWFDDLEVTNPIAGSITGQAATVATITGLAPDTATEAAAQAAITSLGTLTGLTMGGNIVMADNSITGIDTLTFTDTAGTIAGIANGNLLDKTAAETITGYYLFDRNFTGTTEVGMRVDMDKTVGSNRTSNDTAFNCDNAQVVDETFTNSGYSSGIGITSYKVGLGTLSKLYGERILYGSSGADKGTITTAYGLQIFPLLGSATSAITTNYGIKIENMVGTTKYAIYSGTGAVHFGDTLACGAITSTGGTNFSSNNTKIVRGTKAMTGSAVDVAEVQLGGSWETQVIEVKVVQGGGQVIVSQKESSTWRGHSSTTPTQNGATTTVWGDGTITITYTADAAGGITIALTGTDEYYQIFEISIMGGTDAGVGNATITLL